MGRGRAQRTNVASGVAEHVVAYIFVVAYTLPDLPGRPIAFVCTSSVAKRCQSKTENSVLLVMTVMAGIVVVVIVVVEEAVVVAAPWETL